MKSEPVIQAHAPAVPEKAAPVERPRAQAEVKPSAPVTTASIPAPPKRSKTDEEAAIRRYASEISRQMEKSLSARDYPRVARDRNWQGTTHLVLRIRAGGKLERVTIATSSGYEVLDQRAIELVNSLALPSVPEEIHSSSFAVRVPVRFALKD
jgi:protein TonB